MPKFTWDETKNRSNEIKHGLKFEEACLIFDGQVFTVRDERRDYGEDRQLSIGSIRGVVVVLVVHTARAGSIRIISARLANRRERKQYDEYLRQATGRARG